MKFIRSGTLAVLGLCALSLSTQAASWTKLTNAAPGYTNTMLQLPDGRIMVLSDNDHQTWYFLKPDANGSYINGTWSSSAAMGTARLYFTSNVLPNGKLWVLGGEYSGTPLTQNTTNTAEIYDPAANTWTAAATFPQPNYGDVPSSMVKTPSGLRILAGYIFGPQSYLYDYVANTWAATGTKLRSDSSDEEGWVKLPDGRVLSYDIFSNIPTNGNHAQIYNPATGTWTDASNGIIPALSSSAVGYELGPSLRLQDGRVLVIGATQHTALYTPSTNTWAAGPDILSGANSVTYTGSTTYGADDAPGAILPNGHVLFAADQGPIKLFSGPTKLFDFNPSTSTLSDVTATFNAAVTAAGATNNLAGNPSYITRMIMLPTGQLLFSDSSSRLWVYTPDPGIVASARPIINSVAYNGSGVFTLTGKQINGQSAGSSYGDDVQNDSNYPIIRLTNSTGKVFYCKTYNWSSVDVAGGTGTVNFTLNTAVNTTLTAGNYLLTLSGAGIQSAPLSITITSGEVSGL